MKKKIEEFISKKIDQELYSGCQVLIGRQGNAIVNLSLGSKVKGLNEQEGRVQENTLFNIESITKVMVTLPLVFKLIEEGRLHLDDKIIFYIPEFGTSQEKEGITIRNLLNFTGGIPLEDPVGCKEAASRGDLKKAWDLHYQQELACQPEIKVLYSDVSCRILGKLLERIMERSFEFHSSYLHYILSGPKTWFWEYASSDYSFFGDLVSKKAVGKMGGAGTFFLIDPEYDLIIVYLTNYGQPERTLEGETGWNKFFKDIDVMGLCNIVLGNIER